MYQSDGSDKSYNKYIYLGLGGLLLTVIMIVALSRTVGAKARAANAGARIDLRAQRHNDRTSRKDCKQRCKGYGLLDRRGRSLCISKCLDQKK